MEHAYALIMAGGAGTRLWPLSRKRRPKPLLPLVDQARSMIQISVDRLDPLFSKEQILIVASQVLAPLLREELPELPPENFIVEPTGRDSAPAFGLGAIHIHHRDPDAVMAVLTADHYIEDEAGFRAVLDAACQVASSGSIVTLGIQPSFPSTGFGYLKRGELRQTYHGVQLYNLERFVEKPDEMTAEKLLAEGGYSWNSGMFIWPVRRVLAEFKNCAPDMHADFEKLTGAIGRDDYDSLLAEVWSHIKRTSIDFALMEHITNDILVIPTSIGWSDIGNFEALYDILSEDQQHVISGREPVLIDSKRLLIFSNRLVAAVGVEDLVIIDTDDVLMICPRSRAQDVKQLVEKMKRNEHHEYL